MNNGFFKIEIDGQQFEQAYLVYVVKLSSQNYGDFFYIGQTGDRNYLTARPAFRRLAGHFSDQGHSTENQIYRQIAFKILNIESASKKQTFDKQTKDKVSSFLSNCKIEMFVHPLSKFLLDTNVTNHKSNREFSEIIENELINYFVQLVGESRLLNKKIPKTNTVEFNRKTIEIINYINSN